jgi:hypothetical protein
MIKRALCIFCPFMLFLTATLSAHTPLLVLEDNADGTLTIQGGFSTGQGAAGVDLYVKNRLEGKVLLHLKFPEISEIEIDIPEEPYYLVMDAGPGHKVVKLGPPPPGGFTDNLEAMDRGIEKEDLHGLPVPIPVIVAVLIVIVVLSVLLPKVVGKKR